MATTIINDEGQEVTVFTEEEIAEREAALKAEFEKQLADKDAHVKEKLDQFQQAKKSVDVEAEEAKRLAEEAKRLAEEAKLSVTQAQEAALTAKKEAMITSVVGTDPELRKRIEDAYGIINLPASSDLEIQARVQAAMTLAGIKNNPINSNLSFSGSFAPNVQASNSEQKQAEYDAWKKELGISF